MSGQHIHLVFKTHLDIGFTEHAAKVRRQYHERFIPQAIETGEHFFNEDPDHPQFIWTTGAWLVWDYLETVGKAEVARMEQAIRRGLIRWHGLPFTTHTELMSPDLFRAGLSYSAELDQRFGVTTIAAKMTDVPGHTRGIVPLLAEAGIRFLHLGVNTASPVPDVPDVFRWRAPDGSEVLVMYQNSYGATHFPDGSGEGLSFAHTSDNIGPQSVSQTAEVYRHLRAANPGATITASTLEAYGALMWEKRESFPIVDLEIGDSWIHGVASDPVKTARFLALQRLCDGYAETALTPKRQAFGRGLTMVAEHTWGVDIKTFLRDVAAWDRADFDAARASDYRFAYSEASWAEQRAYLKTAIAALDGDDLALAAGVLRVVPEPAVPATGTPVEVGQPVVIDGWSVIIDPQTGDVARLVSPRGKVLDGLAGSLIGYRHESYDHADVAAQMDSYIQHREDWAILDHDKPGMQHALTARSGVWTPRLLDVLVAHNHLTIRTELPDVAADALGAPKQAETVLRPIKGRGKGEAIGVSLVLRAKPANRMAEAGFMTFTPVGVPAWEFLKMGLWQSANRIARRGGGALQAVMSARSAKGAPVVCEIGPSDTPLVAPADTPFMRFAAEPPTFGAGIRFNLYNNKWGTNFPMWWEGDFVARFRLEVGL